MDFVIRLLVFTNWKGKTNGSILIIVNWLTKMIHYKPVKVIINASSLVEVIIKIIVQYYGLINSIMSDCGSVFTLKFWSSLCYFFGIKQKLSTVFYPQTDGRAERQNSTIEVYLQAFLNYKQDN